MGPSSIFTPPSRPALEAFRSGAMHKEVSLANIASASGKGGADDKDEEKGSGLGLSIQTYNIMNKIDELDRILLADSSNDGREKDGSVHRWKSISILEAHPELAFLRLSGGENALMSKKSQQGRDHRFQLLGKEMDLGTLQLDLRASTWPIEVEHKGQTSTTRVAMDDILDALICTVVARKWTRGKSQPILRGEDDRDHGSASFKTKRNKIEEPSEPQKRDHDPMFDEQGLPMNIWT